MARGCFVLRAANDSDTESEDEGGEAEVKASVDAPMADHPDYHGKGWRGGEEEGGPEGGAAKGSSTPDRTEEKKPLWDAGDASSDEEEEDTAVDDAASSSSSDDEGGDGARPQPTTFRPMPPPRRAMEAVEVEFTKLEMDHLPARENRGAAGPGCQHSPIPGQQSEQGM